MRNRLAGMMRAIGMLGRPQKLTDVMRRQIWTMIDGGMTDSAISDCFGFSAAEIASARASNPIDGSLS